MCPAVPSSAQCLAYSRTPRNVQYLRQQEERPPTHDTLPPSYIKSENVQPCVPLQTPREMHAPFPRSKPEAPQSALQGFSGGSTGHTLGSPSRPASRPVLCGFLRCISPKTGWANLGPAQGVPFLSLGQRGGGKVQSPTPNAVTTARGRGPRALGVGVPLLRGIRVSEQVTLGVMQAALSNAPRPNHTPRTSAEPRVLSTPRRPRRSAVWRPLSPLRAPGHSPHSAAAVSRGSPGPPCRHRGRSSRLWGSGWGRGASSGSPYFTAILGQPPDSSPAPCAQSAVQSVRGTSVPPRSRWGQGGGDGEGGGGGGGEGGGRGRVKFDGRAFNSFRSCRAPVSTAAASCLGATATERAHDRCQGGRRSELLPPPPLPEPTGPGMPGPGLLTPSPPARGRELGFPRKRL